MYHLSLSKYLHQLIFWQFLPGSSYPPRPSSAPAAPQLNATSSFSVFRNSASTLSGQHLASSLPPEVAQRPFQSYEHSNQAGKSSSSFRHAAPPSLSHQIIPAEDPQRAVDLGDDDGNPEVSGEGLGEEDEPELVDDELDDEEEEETAAEDMGIPHARHPLPTWLYDNFKAKVAESGRRNDKGLPPLYANHDTFWFPRPSTFFILQRNGVSPPLLYNPRFFLWDPEVLCRIPCPNCRTALQRHGPISHPRRCIDSDSSFWIIGYRYRCRVCCHRKSQKHTVTFRSWDSRILGMLPSELAAEFPARLSHRSGISKVLFGWTRSCFQNGMGSKQFSDALRVQHLLKYDELHLQYLDMLARRRLDGWAGQKYEAFLPFDNTSPRGFHGYIFGAQWIGNMYDQFIEKHRNHFHQHTSQLTCEIGSLDHSHKV